MAADEPAPPSAGVDDLSPPNVREIDPYVPGKPIETLARELGLGGPAGIVKLASNENPFGPSPLAVRAVGEALEELHRYPDSTCHELTQALAERLGVDVRQLIFGNGSNEIIELTVRSFCSPAAGDEAIMSQYGFGMAKIALQAHGIPIRVAKARGYAYDLEAMLELVTPRTKLVYLDNPNNPTGSHFGKRELERFLERLPPRPVVLLDEAYLEFVDTDDYPRGLDFVGTPAREGIHPRLVLCRTFSKAHGLAGLRIGYAVASPAMIDLMHRVREPFNVNVLAQKAALAALSDDEHLARTRERVLEGRRYLSRELAARGFQVAPTQTNFVLVDLGRPARQVYEALLVRGVITRPLAAYGLEHHLRVNVGLPEEDRRFVETLTEVMGR